MSGGTSGQQPRMGSPPTEQNAAAQVPVGQMAGDQAPPGTRGPNMHPGDELPANAPGAGENICRVCSGSGKLSNGRPCDNCGGTGKVIESVAGGP